MRHRINTECIGSQVYAEAGESFCLSCDEYLGRAKRSRESHALISLGVIVGLHPSLKQRARVGFRSAIRRLVAA